MIIGRYTTAKIPLSRVSKLHVLHGDRIQVEYDGDRSEVYGAAVVESAIEGTVQASFPADGAQQVIIVYDEDGRPAETWHRNILGFFMDGYGDLRAVTLDGTTDDPVVLFKDGHVERFEDRWNDLGDYLAEQIKEFDEKASQQPLAEQK